MGPEEFVDAARVGCAFSLGQLFEFLYLNIILAMLAWLTGYCGYASVNCLLSLVGAPVRLAYEFYPRHVNMLEMTRVLALVLRHPSLHGFFSAVDVVTADALLSDATAWRQELTRLNDPRYRYLALFLRAPLFFNSHPDASQRAGLAQYFSAHWSPLLAYLPATPNHPDLVLVGDTNEAYGLQLVPAHQLLAALATRDPLQADAPYRGLLRCTLHSGGTAAPVALPPTASTWQMWAASTDLPVATPYMGPYTKGDVVELFLQTKARYYAHIGQHGNNEMVRHFSNSLCYVVSAHQVSFYNNITHVAADASDSDMAVCAARFASPGIIGFGLLPAADPVASKNLARRLRRHNLFLQPQSATCSVYDFNDESNSATAWATLSTSPPTLPSGYQLVEVDAACPRRLSGPTMAQWLQTYTLRMQDMAHVLARAYPFHRIWGKDAVTHSFGAYWARVPVGVKAGLRLVIVYRDEAPVSIASVFTNGPVAAIFNVCTLPTVQRSGLGRYLTWLCMSWAREAGHRYVTLQASPSGAKVYKKLGFVDATALVQLITNSRVISVAAAVAHQVKMCCA
jgi:hypothetical protein